jgi:hypothetical protein
LDTYLLVSNVFLIKKRKESQAISPLISYYTSAENSAPSFLGYYAISVTSSLQLKYFATSLDDTLYIG